MTESATTTNHAQAKTKKVPIRDRAFTMGTVTGVNGYRADRAVLKKRFGEGGYTLYETSHFLLCTRTQAPTTILVHQFAPREIDADIGCVFVEELKPLHILGNAQQFGDIFGAVVCLLFPVHLERALHLYATNTLRQYRSLLSAESGVQRSNSTIDAFAHIYRRVFELQVGRSFLDAGCSFGFLPVLLAERFASISRVVGIDLLTDSFPIMHRIAEEQKLRHVQFVQADLLATHFDELGCFDTVVALHILEHFAEADMYRVLAHLLQVTAQRLILAVPYEPGTPEVAYGHEQLFTRTKLEAVGKWCIEYMGGYGRMQCEDCAGGLLLIERI